MSRALQTDASLGDSHLRCPGTHRAPLATNQRPRLQANTWGLWTSRLISDTGSREWLQVLVVRALFSCSLATKVGQCRSLEGKTLQNKVIFTPKSKLEPLQGHKHCLCYVLLGLKSVHFNLTDTFKQVPVESSKGRGNILYSLCVFFSRFKGRKGET